MALQVIGTGLGRTGTMSLKMALEQLGYGDCFHMVELMKKPERLGYIKQAQKTGTTDWDALFEGFGATVDYPVCLFYKDLIDHYPEAKFIHTVRDPERWYESVKNTIFGAKPRGMAQILSMLMGMMKSSSLRRVAPVLMNNDALIWKQQFHNKFEDKAYAMDVYHAWTEEVKNTVPADRLLVYELKEGWEPLCTFLGKPVPATDFPRSNDQAEFNRKLRRLMKEGVFEE